MKNRLLGGKRFLLVTAAYNEERYIEGLIKSIIGQTVHPLRWVIVSDGSTDATDQIVRQYAAQYDFIELFRVDEDHPRNFAAQVIAINAGIDRLIGREYDFIGNIDADVSFEPTYFSDLLDTFAADPGLGLAGGSICEEQNGEFQSRPFNREWSVAHAVQFFRRECFEALGGHYTLLPYGGPDSYATVQSRMNGWRVRSIAELKVFHHRPTGSASGWIRGAFREGRMDYSLAVHPICEIGLLVRRVRVRPFILYPSARLAGFILSYCRKEKRVASKEYIKFSRQEQAERIRQIFRKPARSAADIVPEREPHCRR